MARYFLRLKLTLLGAALRLNWQQLVGFVMSIVAAVPLSIGGFLLMVWLGGETAGGSGLRLTLAVLTMLWIVGPPLMFGVDETLDPTRLRLLPLTQRELAVGLLVSSAVGVGPISTLVFLSGAVVGFAPAGPGALVVVGAVIAQFLLCLVVARTVTTLLSRWLRSRRGKDVVVMAGALLGIGFAALGQVPSLLLSLTGEQAGLAPVLDGIESYVGLAPIAWAGSAILAVDEGRLLAGTAWLAATVALVVGLAVLWVKTLANVSTRSAASGKVADRGLFSGIAAVLPRNRVGAAAARELRYQWRVPQLRVQWIFIPMLGVALVLGALLAPGDVSPLLVFGSCAVVAFNAFSAINVFGGDRGAVWMLVSAGGIGRADLLGKNVAGVLLLLPFVTVLSVALAAITGGWVYVPAAVFGGVALLGTAYGLGDVASVLAPSPLPESTGNVWASSSGSGCITALAQGLAMLAGTLLVLPAIVAVGFAVAFASVPAMLLVSVFAALYGMGLWWAGLTVAARVVAGREPETVSALTTAH